MSHERNITVGFDGRFHNIPSVVDGKHVSNAEAIEAYRSGRTKSSGIFNTQQEAEGASKSRSESFGGQEAMPRQQSGPQDFFSPGAWPQPDQGPMDQVTGFLQDPRGQAALLQAGLSLMGGPAWGDTGASQIARAVGAGGEAIGRQDVEARKQTESESKVELQEARAGAATARAGAAGTSADLARERLGIARLGEEGKRERAMLGGRIRLSGMYQTYLKDLAKRNSDPLRTGAPETPLGMQDWIRQNPTLRTLGLLPEGGAGSEGEEIPAMTPSVSPGPTLQSTGAPQVGEVRRGFRFKGGDPSKEASWERV